MQIRALALLALLLMPPNAWATDSPRHGLMWNRTGLPLVFPLVVRTDPGRDYLLTLRDAQTGAPALAAYIEGGRFFRVLAPPGTYYVRFRHGQGWQDEARFFGADTEVIDIQEPLRFAVQGIGTKGGHQIDLRGISSQQAGIAVEPRRDCATVGLAPPGRTKDRRRAGQGDGWEVQRAEKTALPPPLAVQAERLALALVWPPVRRSDPPHLLRYEVRGRVC